MQAAGRSHKQIFNEINITPLTDIFLVLLIIMMVVAPMMQQVRKDIKPPTLGNGSALEPNKVTVEVDQNGTYYVQGVETKLDNLAATLKEQEDLLLSKAQNASSKNAAAQVSGDAAATPDEKSLVIRADKSTKSGQVLKVFEAARDAGFAKVTVAGEPLAGDRQTTLQQSNMEGAQ